MLLSYIDITVLDTIQYGKFPSNVKTNCTGIFFLNKVH